MSEWNVHLDARQLFESQPALMSGKTKVLEKTMNVCYKFNNKIIESPVKFRVTLAPRETV
jgi:hypothetical protein